MHSSDKDALVPLVTHERLNSYLMDMGGWIAPAAGTWISDVSRLRQVIETRPLVPHIRN